MPTSEDQSGASQATREGFMRMALEEADSALHLGEVPVGAIVVHGGLVVARGFNQPIRGLDPTAHAEVVALRQAARALGNYRLLGASLYVTIEPCLMCVGALVQARIAEVIYGAPEPKAGALRSTLQFETLSVNHRFRVVSGILEDDCRQIVQDFFKFRREGA
ncbi:MAG TPA: tRNA adenosine(34) deaminase TadA [Vicinamibacteria bacterium]